MGELDFIKLVESGGEKVKDFSPLYKKSEVSNVCVGFDTEDNSKGDCHLLIFFDGKKYWEFTSPVCALYWLLFSDWGNKQLIIWCINTSYDLNNLTNDWPFLVNRVYNKSRFILATLYFNNSVKFYDVMNFYSLSTYKLGKLFELDKLDFNFNENRKFNKNGSVIISKKEIAYCKRDTEIGQKAGKFICKKFENFGIRQTATVASCALQIYLKKFDSVDFTKFNRNRYLVDSEIFYNSYFGGRTEPFVYGETTGRIRYYDINSLYAYVMKKFLYPNPYSQIRICKTAEIANGVVDCLVKVPNMQIPPLPVKMKLKYNIKLIFPVGTFRGVWCLNELQNAVSLGVQILKVYKAIEYKECLDLFSGFVNEIYDKRVKSKTKADSEFYKIVLNGLYGKFAEKRRVVRYVPLDEGGQFDPILYEIWSQTTETFLPTHNNVILSSYITAYARCMLLYWLIYVQDLGGEVLYCDTDSIIYKGEFDLPTGTGLGQLKEEARIEKITILGAKYYQYRTKRAIFSVCKGIPKEKQAEMFRKGKVTYSRPIKYREAIRRHLRANVWMPYTKKGLTVFDKRRIMRDGRKTRPLIINPTV